MSEGETSQKRFRSLSGEEVVISLLSGHVARVGPEWRPLPTIFHQDAYAKGCISDDMLNGIPAPPGQQALDLSAGELGGALSPQERMEKIEGVIRQMVSENNPEKFTTAGMPRAELVNEACGFTTSADERATALASITG
jgi:hypothetical protein